MSDNSIVYPNRFENICEEKEKGQSCLTKMIAPSNPSIHLNDYKLENDASNDNMSLCYLLRVQSIFGITYCGTTQYGKRHEVKRFLLISYDMLLIVLFFGAYYNAFSNDSFDRIFRSAPNKGVMNFVFKMSGIAIVMEYLVIKVMLIINGSKIYSTIESIGYVRSKVDMLFIYIYMSISAVVYSLALTLNFVDLNQTFVEFYSDEKVKAFMFLGSGLNNAMVRTSILMLLFYAAVVIKRQIRGNTENLANDLVKNPSKICRTVIELRTKIETINSLTGIMMLVKIVSNAVQIAGCICVVSVGQLDLTSTLSLLGFVITNLSDIILSCRSSQMIICAFNELCTTIENKLSLQSFNDDDYRQLRVIISMKDSFRYQVLNLFDLQDLTILSIIGYVANYAVILIQTQ